MQEEKELQTQQRKIKEQIKRFAFEKVWLTRLFSELKCNEQCKAAQTPTAASGQGQASSQAASGSRRLLDTSSRPCSSKDDESQNSSPRPGHGEAYSNVASCSDDKTDTKHRKGDIITRENVVIMRNYLRKNRTQPEVQKSYKNS